MIPDHLPDNILLIDKPAGMTSFDVIRQLRRQTGIKKFGHAGTLDPAATGLLVLGVGPGTKQLSSYIALDKVYDAVIMLGEARTTGDMDGVVEHAVDVPMGRVTTTVVSSAVAAMVGTHELPVSAYSAIKKAGVPMYVRAREAAKRGDVVADVPRRPMRVDHVELHSVTERVIDGQGRVFVTVSFSVGSGTYIRSLAVAVGAAVGYPAVLYSLRRTRVGEFTLRDAVDVTSVQQLEIV